MKTANQVREYVRRRSLIERGKYVASQVAFYPDQAHPDLRPILARERELLLIEILNAFDTPHKTKLKIPKGKIHE